MWYVIEFEITINKAIEYRITISMHGSNIFNFHEDFPLYRISEHN